MQGVGGFFCRGCVFAFSVIWGADRFAHLDCLERGAFLGDCFIEVLGVLDAALSRFLN